MNQFEQAGFESIAKTICEMEAIGVDRQTVCTSICAATAKALRAAIGPKGAAEMLRAAADQIADQFDA
ncbi:MAG TPA: hypothetical protein PL143_01475 [Rhodocyclaceae bacterium]|nr:hypothetical protein [Rhodocyclaceae bacterium]